MKILFVIEQLNGGGAERVTALLASELSNREGIEVFLCKYYSTEDEYENSSRVTQFCNQTHYAEKYKEIICNYRYTNHILKVVHPDVVISLSMYKANIPLAFGNIRRPFKLVLSERNDPSRLPSKMYLKKLRDISYMLADGIVFQTEDAQRYFNEKLKSVVIPNPVNIPDGVAYTANREKYIINCSRLNEQKNLPMLIKAFSMISHAYPDYTLRIYGNGPDKASLINLIDKLELSDKIQLCGYDKNILDKISKASIYVSSSDYEGISNSMIEALALGTPTICTDCPIGGARLMIKHGENGLLVKVGDIDGLAKAMNTMLSDYQAALLMGKRAINIREDFSITKIASMWLRFFDTIGAGKAGL